MTLTAKQKAARRKTIVRRVAQKARVEAQAAKLDEVADDIPDVLDVITGALRP